MTKVAYSRFRCAICNRKLKQDHYIIGRDRKITGSIPRYCWPGEGCNLTNKQYEDAHRA
jgi:hypothetical protein